MTDGHLTIALDGFPALMTDLLTLHLTNAGFSVVPAEFLPSARCTLRWSGEDRVEPTTAVQPAPATIVVTDTPAAARRWRRQQALAVAARDVDIDSLLALVRATASDQKTPTPKSPGPAAATDRELEVMELIAEGHDTDQIAAALDISPHTVRTHIQHVISRLGVNSRAAAVVRLTDEGLIAPGAAGN